VRAVDDKGSERWVCTGVEIGRPILRDEDGADTDEFELTPARWRIISDNFDRYRLMAERRLIPTPANIEQARRIRRGMQRRRGEPLTAETLAALVADWRALEGDPRGRMYELADRRGVHRSTIYRQLRVAADAGLLGREELPRRRRAG
jgi:hypothetical protein